jgi:glucose/arabinose dehydrogenase
MRAALAVLALLLAGCASEVHQGGAPPPPAAPQDVIPPSAEPRVALAKLVDGLAQPLFVTHAGDGSGRLFLVEQGGKVKVWKDGAVLPVPFLDLTGRVSTGTEQGLLSIAFAPDYAASGRFFVDYTDVLGDTQVVRYQVSALDADLADPASARTILAVDQPYANHNGGLVLFGPDGMLYVGLGDGGSGGDPQDRAQDTQQLLGKLLRIDVRGDTYAVPADNPFARGGGRGEVWAYGLRNPWRFSFDRATRDLFLADVGQNAVEEVDFQAAGGAGGANYGWNVWEGSRRYKAGDAPGAVFPVAEYDHGEGRCSVTGGYVYRGSAVPSLRGWYLYADYCSGTLWGLASVQEKWEVRTLLETGLRVSSFGEDAQGEVYVVDHSGAVQRLVPASP